MRVGYGGLVLLVALAGGCRQTPGGESPAPASSPSAAASPSPGSVARCGESPEGFRNILAGTETEFFTARTRQSLKIKPGVEVKTKEDGKGHVVELTMARQSGGVNVSCRCPVGCSSDPGPGHGCVVVYTPGGGDAHCSGDCVTPNSCCFGCGFMSPF